MDAYTLTMFWVNHDDRLTDTMLLKPEAVIPLLPPWLKRRGKDLKEVALEGAMPGVKALEIGSVRVAYYCPQCKAYYGGPPRMDRHSNMYSMAGWQGYQLTCAGHHIIGNQIEKRG